ncbi:LysR family transcriptional regulator [Kitasatospora fiedleri]|uniref:LysR family transcriptional regulator n=1 Tax=Kitasatospora fiedleri TaxID=2991545 RepID=UPI00384EB0A1
MDLELRHLRVLCAIADSGSVGRAAAAIGASQPATSTQLRRIERHLGAAVFDRTAAGVVPTTFGAEVPAAAREPLARVDRLGRAATPDGGRPHRELRLTADCPALLPGTLARARHLRPELRFALTPPGDAEPPDWHPGHEGPGTAVVAPSARGSFLVFRQADGYRPPTGPRRRAGSAR